MTQKHIALIHFRLSLRGGLETRLFNYVNAFLARGFRVSVISSRIDSSVSLPKEVEVIQLSTKPFPKLLHLRQWRFANAVQQHLGRHSYDLSLSLGRTFGQQAILAAGNHRGYLQARGKSALSLDDRVQILLDARSFQQSQIIFAASEMMKQELVDLYQVDGEKIHLLYPPLNVDKFHADVRLQRDVLRMKMRFSSDKLHFAFVSTGHSRKGLPLLNEVFAQLDPSRFQLWVAGSKRKTFMKGLPNVHFLGFVPNPQELYAAVDATIHPAIYEPFGQVVSESIACGTPVLISGGTGAKELLRPEDGRVIDTLDTDAWMEAIQSFDPSLFSPNPNFVSGHRLDVDAHVDRMIGLLAGESMG